MSKHTPGPWQYVFEGGTTAFITESDGSTIICIRTTENTTAHKNLAANVSLIAAAPDLLVYALCEDARSRGEDIAETVLKRHGFNPKAESAQDFVDRIRRAAIAKAEGRE